jgi:hypothetical protein
MRKLNIDALVDRAIKMLGSLSGDKIGTPPAGIIVKDETKKPKVKRKRPKLLKELDLSAIAKELPDFMQGHEQLKGVSVGICVATGKKPRGCMAHAHTNFFGKGYICCRSEADFKKTTTMKHELAHILTGKGHQYDWAVAYENLVKGCKQERWLNVPWLQKKYKFKIPMQQ